MATLSGPHLPALQNKICPFLLLKKEVTTSYTLNFTTNGTLVLMLPLTLSSFLLKQMYAVTP